MTTTTAVRTPALLALAAFLAATGPGLTQAPPTGDQAPAPAVTPSPDWAWGTWATPSCEDPAFVSFGTDQLVVARDREGQVWAFAKEAFVPLGGEGGWTRVRYGSGLGNQVQLARPLDGGRLEIADFTGGQPPRDDELATGAALPAPGGPWRLTEYRRCAAVPGGTAALVHAEAAAVFESLRTVERGCADDDEAACGAALLDAVDVSGDGHVSAAELARLVRVAAYLAGVTPLTEGGGEPTTEKELSAWLAGGLLLGPSLGQALVLSLDYDADGKLSTRELAQDRAVLSLTDAARVDTAAGRSELSRVVGQLKQLGPLLAALARSR